jgi:hypothetical protein
MYRSLMFVIALPRTVCVFELAVYISQTPKYCWQGRLLTLESKFHSELCCGLTACHGMI